MKKLISAILALCLAAGLTACAAGGQTITGADVSATVSSDTTAAETAVNWESSGLPQIDFEQADFTTLYSGAEPDHVQTWRLIDAAEANGEVLNDAIYNRNRKIEELYNIKFKVIYDTNFEASVKASIMAGDKSYDALFGGANSLLNISQNDYLFNWYNLKYTDLNAVWWDKSVVDGLTVYNQLYMCTGDISPLTNVRVYSLVFNKDLCKNLGLDLPYESVLEGNWTMDLFSQYITDVNSDLNGDSKMDYDDRWGYLSQDGNSYMMYFSGGGRVTDTTSDGGRELSFQSERNISLAVKALQISIDDTKTLMANKYVTNNGGSWQAASAWFAAGGSLMRSSVFEPVPRDYRAMDTDFGVLPYPKLDESQDQYYTLPENTSYMYAVPITSDGNYVSLILEALAAESVSTVSAAFYDVALNGKVVRDNESKDMLDIIFGSKVFDIGYFIGAGGITSKLTSLESADSTDAASAFATVQKSAQTALDKFLENYAELKTDG